MRRMGLREGDVNADGMNTQFHYDPLNPDASLAKRTAEKWRGSSWRSPLFRYVSEGCAVLNDEHRKALFDEIERDMKVVESAAECFPEDELSKLRNLKRCVEMAEIAGRQDSAKEEKDERKNGPDIELIF